MLSLLSGVAAAAGESAETEDRLVLYPARLRYRQFLSAAGMAGEPGCRYVPYAAIAGRSVKTGWKSAAFLRDVWRLLDRCRRVELFFLSPSLDWSAAYAAAAVARLKGVPTVLHDFSFLDDDAGYRRRLLQSLCLSPGAADSSASQAIVDREPYRQARKTGAVPHVIVVADGENQRVKALARRAHELVKQKYPRTEFTVLAFTDDGTKAGRSVAGTLVHRTIVAEADLQAAFVDGDTVMLLSRGGLNDLIAFRARLAGFPIIVNGFGFAEPSSSPAQVIVVPRDSYSALAEAVIRLVDDDAYYRGFAAS